MQKQTTTITIQDKYNPIKEHVYVFEAKGQYLFIWYRQHIYGKWKRVTDQHSMGDLQFSNWPDATASINGYEEYYNRAKAQYNKEKKMNNHNNTTNGVTMNKYTLTPKALVKARKEIYGANDYPLPVHTAPTKRGRILNTGINFVVHYADGSASVPCRKLKDALMIVELCPANEMPASFKNLIK